MLKENEEEKEEESERRKRRVKEVEGDVKKEAGGEDTR